MIHGQSKSSKKHSKTVGWSFAEYGLSGKRFSMVFQMRAEHLGPDTGVHSLTEYSV